MRLVIGVLRIDGATKLVNGDSILFHGIDYKETFT
jgi:hypothetical protein